MTLATVALVTLIKSAWNEYTGVPSPLLLYYSAIILSAWYGGRIQGMLATALAILCAHIFFVFPHNPLTITSPYALRYVLFALDSLLVTLICSALQRSLNQATRAQEASAENELRFRRVFESNMIGLMVTRADGTVIECNDYILNMLGYTYADVLAGRMNWRDFTPPEYLAQSLDVVHEVNAGEKVTPFEKIYLCRDGTQVPVIIGPARLTSEHFVTFVLDISERKRAEEAINNSYAQLEERVHARTKELRHTAEQLQESQAFTDSVIENLPNMVFVKDAKELRFVRLNRAGESLLGRMREELIGKGDFDFFPETEARFFQAKDREVLEGGVVVDIDEEPISTPTGLRYLHTKKIPILGPDRQPQYLLGISEDITDSKAAEQQRLTLIQEQAARAEAEKTADQLRFLSDASAALNETLDLRSMLDKFAATVIGYMADWCEVVLIEPGAKEVEERVIAQRDPNLREYMENYRARGEFDWSSESGIARVIRTGNPELHPVVNREQLKEKITNPARLEVYERLGIHSLVIVPLQSFGRVIGALSMSETTTTRTFSTLDLSLALDLAKRASFAIENSRLFKKSQEASRAKSAFLANISHEIRTPLGAMLGFAELLEGENLSNEQKRYLATLSRNGKQLLRIVDEILDISKVESERIQIETLEFNLHNLLEEVYALLRLQAEEKGLTFNMPLPTDLPQRIVTDPTRLRQILINVIGNAIKFTPIGEVDVQIATEPTEAPVRRRLRVRVRDTGVGISHEQRDKLFQPFVQADNSMTRRFGGTGLGLFLSRRLARLLGGDVVLGLSELGHGSEFVITVNFEPRNNERATPSQPEPQTGAVTRTANKMKILIVDDAPDNRMLIELYLTRLGYTADAAESGRQAVEMALKAPYALILMDVQMPGMDGFEAVAELRRHRYRGPIVALTAHTMKGDRERCLAGGFDDYLGKPIDRELLRRTLQRLLEPHSSSPDA